ncbi:hypothetical protein G7Y89_g14589 [Cudoniella acicularis]|uniref:Transcription factor domain-containing protein n=1 Tax=Cudoniella acicularis TaxID=354080 RepID=A0A8H4R0Y0_9HELO|nr:hypothetical protein G7Y89_g14589 [Cudoniella acicularis]
MLLWYFTGNPARLVQNAGGGGQDVIYQSHHARNVSEQTVHVLDTEKSWLSTTSLRLSLSSMLAELSSRKMGLHRQKKLPAAAVNSTSAFGISINTPRLDRNIDRQDWIPQMILAPSTSVEDQATCFFFGNYISGTEMLNTCGNYQYVYAIYANQTVGIPLRQAVTAIGLAGLANFWSAPNIMAKANGAYCSALRLVNSGLGNIEEAKSDQALVAIILLGLYEINTSSGRRSMKSWTEHILGATALVQLRGKDSLSSPLGRNIFVHLRNGIVRIPILEILVVDSENIQIASCIQRHTAVPNSITELTKISLQYESPVEAASTKLGLLITKHAALRASMKEPQDYENTPSIIRSLQALDQEYLEWTHALPPEFISTQVPVSEGARSKDAYGTHYLQYSSIWIASIWNNYRCARILANELLLSHLSHSRNNIPEIDQQPYENILDTTITTLHTLSNDIFNTVPFFLSTDTNEAPRALAGNLTLWPLYLASQTSGVLDDVRRWARERLRYIANTMGIRQAEPMVERLTEALDSEVRVLGDSVAEVSMKEAL